MKRRELQFDSFDQVKSDVEHLLSVSHEQVGQWDLAQVCKHLALAFGGSIMGFPSKAPWPMRLLAPVIKRRVLKSGRIPEGAPTAAVPKAGGDPKRAATQLSRAIDRYLENTDPLQPHPLFGKLTPEEWTRFHLVHCAHHLSFLVPQETE